MFRRLHLWAAACRGNRKEAVMERNDDIIDLGVASDETKGAIGKGEDEFLRQSVAGISAD